MGGELTGFRKLVVGRNTWRIVYRITDDKAVEICEIWAVGERADAEVYAEAKARVRAAGGSRPDVVRLGEVIDRLGTLTDHIHIDEVPAREPVPDWLANRLICTVGMAREEVAGGTRPGGSRRSLDGVSLGVTLARNRRSRVGTMHGESHSAPGYCEIGGTNVKPGDPSCRKIKA
ncbi:hypothetical protein [Streptosporangium sp. NPDC006930]|uniref:type II toxin-antitoxin system RelE family toxin n=1 Tax=Streptosporangium sp. NPDC006930 TaxID=3154783 RepID=UPI00341DB199